MPKSKRNKIISLSRATTKGREGKTKLVEQIRESFNDYKSLYVFSIENMRTSMLKEVRAKWISSRFFFGKNKVMQIALGKDEEGEIKENLSELSECVVGNCGLMFTNEPEDEITRFFKNFKESDYPRAGFVVSQTVELPKGQYPQFAHSMEPYLRTNLGLPTSLKNGIIHLEKDFTVCTTGDSLTPEQAKILKLLDMKLSEFRLKLACVWTDGKVKKFDE